MSNVDFVVPKLKDKDCWLDMRHLAGGYGWRGDRSLLSINTIITHHTVTNQYQNAVKEFTEIWRHRRYGGTPYHFLISSEEKNGYAVVGYMGDVGSIRAHAVNAKGKPEGRKNSGNNYSIGISFIGDHRTKYPTEGMLKSAKLLIDELVHKDPRFPNLKDYSDVRGHGYWDYTWCPDGNQGTILNPMILNINEGEMSEYDKQLEAAKQWNENIEDKFGFKILNKIDGEPMSREDYMIAAHRHTIYLSKTGYDDQPAEVVNE